MNVRVGARTDVGQIRSGNEDTYLSAMPLFAVADGMGGHLAGEVASATAVDAIVAAAGHTSSPSESELRDYMVEANRAVWDKAQDDQDLRGMGTTCTLISMDGDQVHLAHVGDSRAYLYRRGELSQLTEDHTLVERMVREGRLKPEEAQHHPQRSIITRALGVDARVEVDAQTQAVQPGDRLLLCSDGLTSMIDDAAIKETLQAVADPQAAADQLVDLANAAGGEDNITVVVIDIESDTGDAARSVAASEKTKAEGSPEESASPKRRPWIAILLLMLLLGAGWAGYRYAVTTVMWFVGVEDGAVTIFHGFPEDVGFLSYRDPAETTGLAVDDLPEFVRADVVEGYKVESLEAAREYVANLEERAGEFASPDISPSPEPS